MIEVIIGSIFILASLPVAKISFWGGMNSSAIMLVLIFGGVGCILFVHGLKEIIRNNKTENYGQECFGKVVYIYDTGTRVNESILYGAEVIVYINSEHRTMIVKEKVGFNPELYKVGTYVKVKYYRGDINFIGGVSESSVPIFIKESIENGRSNSLENTKDKLNTVETETTNYSNNTSSEDATKLLKVVGTIMIVFAIFWIGISGGIAIMINTMSQIPADHYYLNGEEVTQEEFEENADSLIPKVVMSIFGLVGIVIMAVGVKLCLVKPQKNGEKQMNYNIKISESKSNNYEDTYDSNSDDDDPIKNL